MSPLRNTLLVLVIASIGWRAASVEGDVDELAYLAVADGYWQVWISGAEGRSRRQVTRSTYDKTRVSWFPDGKHVLANSLEGVLYRVDVNSGEEQVLQLPLRGMTDAVLSPDGTRIAFSLSTADARDDNEIWLVGIDGTGLQKLTDMPWLQHEPAFDPGQRWIYFLSGQGQQVHDIWRVSLETRSREQLTAGSLYHFDVATSTDGRVAFSSNRSGNYEIYVLEPGGEGGGARQMTDHPALDGGPVWSPDGRALVFHSLRTGRLNLWRKDIESGSLLQITHHPEGARGAAWLNPRESAR